MGAVWKVLAVPCALTEEVNVARVLHDHRAVFLDRDGTIIHDMKYRYEPEGVQLMLHAVEGLRRLQSAGYRLIIVTNQSAVARGLATEADVRTIHNRLDVLLRDRGIEVSGYYYCPHHPEGDVPEYAVSCDCRKPRPGMLLEAARQADIDLRRSWMLGDIWSDIAAGQAAGCSTVLIPYLPNAREECLEPPTFVAGDLLEAAKLILMEDGTGDDSAN
jgi:D-glycero-D-manno-heptose 1,7-bisphosphate phosphatase